LPAPPAHADQRAPWLGKPVIHFLVLPGTATAGDLNVMPRGAAGPMTACAVWWRWLVRAGLLGVALASAPPAEAQTGVTERGVKAAFVYKFLSYVEWPGSAFAQPDAPMVIGVIGADDLAAELTEVVRGRTVGARPVEVHRLRAADPLTGVNALFIGASEKARIAALARAALARSVLVITESEDALDQGSVINLIVVDGRVRFEVSLDAAERAGLKLSSRMLAVAHLVRMGNN
jgi:hypothetical protein